MHSTTILLSIAALTGTSLSQKSDSVFCSSLESSIFATLLAEAATTPADILSFVATATGIPPLPTQFNPSAHQDQLCAIATALPSSLLPEFHSFAANLLNQGKEYGSEAIEYITDCFPESEASSMTSYLEHVLTATGNICTETAATAVPGSTIVSNGTYPTGTGSVYPTPTGSPTLIPTAAAARHTGALIGVAAMGGAIGAAAIL
ncbi:hypothetical protein F4777DRAFT_479685 [Nemania sp. FL0916]|nr:hypothetical protein F4777DRAFT_479685 [Nemania sp. FL0916]